MYDFIPFFVLESSNHSFDFIFSLYLNLKIEWDCISDLALDFWTFWKKCVAVFSRVHQEQVHEVYEQLSQIPQIMQPAGEKASQIEENATMFLQQKSLKRVAKGVVWEWGWWLQFASLYSFGLGLSPKNRIIMEISSVVVVPRMLNCRLIARTLCMTTKSPRFGLQQ